MRNRAFIGVLGILLALPAAAQTLDLGQTPIPTLTGETELDHMVTDLARQAEQLARAPGAGTPGVRAAIAARRLAAALLDAPDDAFPERTVAGLTLFDHLPALDALLMREGSAISEAAAEFLAADLDIAPSDLPRQPEELDRWMRDIFAELLCVASGENVPDDAPPAWLIDEPRTPEQARQTREAFKRGVPAWAAAPGVAPTTAQRLADLNTLVDEARHSPAFAPAAAATVRRMTDAGAALESAEPWLTAGAREVLGREFSAACEGILAPELQDQSLARLDALAATARIIALASQLNSDSPRRALCDLLERAEPADAASASSRLPGQGHLDFIERTLELAAARSNMPPERQLVRQVRPAWRVLTLRARSSEDGVIAVLGRAISDSSAATDPAVVGAIAAHRRSIDDLAALARLSSLLSADTGDDPATREDLRTLADLVVNLGQDADHASRGPDALDRLHRLCAQAAALEPLPGESDIRAASTGDSWSRVTGGRAAELAQAIDAARTRWAQAWAQGASEQAAADAAAELQNFSRLVRALRDAAGAEDLASRGVSSAIEAWPGWRLARADLATAWEGGAGQMAETTRLALAGEWSRVLPRLQRFEDDFAFVRLTARLDRQARTRAVPAATGRFAGAVAALRELAAGPPDSHAWLADERREIAMLCRYASELARAKRSGHAATERQIREFLADRATRID